MYINYPDHEAELEAMNFLNERTRHCRIGKVTRKCRTIPSLDDIMRPQPLFPAPRVFEQHPTHPWWMQGPWCGQAVQ
ncbi:hypothetical protein CYG48_04965 [Neorhizobium sp. SOG26]|uniref:hypothetical protein n=1 Tax=Neorhizobium sp. SOG26 TaxID=2060726 RepID=UPI000E57A940|nr:hypothetical protein [Neorhizobium sp. SOG26]AXV15108.1 hypothetical protein CYG48_04965 [Neorhizobium sp. SOG26]